MNNCFNRFFTDKGYAIGWAVIGFVSIAIASVVAIVAFIVITIVNINEDDYASNVITVEGVGEVDSSPDIAVFSFTVEEKASTIDVAQDSSAKKTNAVLEYLAGQKIEQDDIQLSGYNAYPQYEWVQEICQFDRPVCPPGENKLMGYISSQSVSVKVRDLDNAGKILSGVGSLQVTNISGLQFVIEDDASLKEEAQKLAINDAKERAKRLSSELGVELKDVVSFYENSGGYPEPYMMEKSMSNDISIGYGGGTAPQLPAGLNTITSRVSVTYEIK